MSIEIKNLCFSYETKTVLDGVSFTVSDGCMCAIMGRNGAGKSTLFKCILNRFEDFTGNILLDGTDVRKLPSKKRAGHLAYIPQEHYNAFNYTVEEIVLMGTAHRLGTFDTPKEEEIKKVCEALDMVGIRNMQNLDFDKLSGGEKQLVLIARALAQGARNIIMDEPTANLDYGNRKKVMSCIRNLADKGYCILFSTHEPEHAKTYADRVVILHKGIVYEEGKPNQIITEKILEEVF